MAIVERCFLCDESAPGEWDSGNPDVFAVDCQVCGQYRISDTAVHLLDQPAIKKNRYKLSGLTRAAAGASAPLLVTSYNLSSLIESAPVARTPLDALDRLLLVIRNHMITLTGGVALEHRDYPLVFAQSQAEFRDLVGLLDEVGHIKSKTRPGGWDTRLTLTGWRRVEELSRVGQLSGQAFVAMWFDPTLDSAWADGIRPALQDAGYTAIRVDRVQHNDKIDDKIIAEIRRSGLLVADFTGNRGGVYYEAGFARGLGIPVVSTVRKDEIDKVHFDTRQYNHILWETAGELREHLHDRIVATLGPARK